MKILICCSKTFYDKLAPVKSKLESLGHSILLPNSHDNPAREYEILAKSPEEHKKWKGEMFRQSEKKIKQVDALLVLNYEKKGQKNYIGGSTLLEMYDAFRHNKKIFMVNPAPENMLKDEVVGLSPIILNGDLEKVE